MGQNEDNSKLSKTYHQITLRLYFLLLPTQIWSKVHELQFITPQIAIILMLEQISTTSQDSHTDVEMKRQNGPVLANDESDSDEDHSKQQLVVRNKYGNMKVIVGGDRPVTLGPDYLCFLPTFAAFCIVSYLVVQLVFSTTQNIYFRLTTLFVCIGQPLSYLLVATSNPGIIVESSSSLSQQQKKKCGKCALVVPRHARHCNDCNVCIQQYDHHCPWTSKCIGGGNLIRFYVFLGWTPIYLIYITVAFVACMSANLVKIQQLPPNKLL